MDGSTFVMTDWYAASRANGEFGGNAVRDGAAEGVGWGEAKFVPHPPTAMSVTAITAVLNRSRRV
ncbi:hypothetical protein Misp01_04150 [Microtetraspora sp. NBRC 13810]|nr:hypothetical protein Misp01_04150 [Microtetraspora sp. NBRC 13810]